ncbi:MAG: hypothetical protein LBH46_02015 [Rickettsiales bacterium]|jgi:hypothetical protein|nr:hypothetical protein [Rickettsiales bacterium]
MDKKIKIALVVLFVVLLSVFIYLGTRKNNKKRDNYYIEYTWMENVKVGFNFLKVNVFTPDNKYYDTEVFTDHDLVDERGKYLKKNRMAKQKENYLLPIDFETKGRWEVIITALSPNGEIKKVVLVDIQ